MSLDDKYRTLGERVDDAIQALDNAQTEAEEYARRLKAMRELVREVDWMVFCDDHPDAKGWFHVNGEVRYDP